MLLLLCVSVLGLRLGHSDVAEGSTPMEAAEVYVAADASAMACGGVLPKGKVHPRVATIVGDEEVVFAVALPPKVASVDAFAGVDHWFYTIFLFHQFEKFVYTFHVEVACTACLYIKYWYKVLLGFLHHFSDVGHLLVGGGAVAVDVVASSEQSCFAGVGEVGGIALVLQGGSFGGFDVDEAYGAVASHFGSVDVALVARDVDAAMPHLGVCRGHCDKARAQEQQQ